MNFFCFRYSSKEVKHDQGDVNSQVRGVLEDNDYRSISMVGRVYKVFAKILANMLQRVIGQLVGETQSAFVQGRQILDGALIVYEVV